MDLVGKVMSLLFNMLSRLVIAFLPRSKCLLISWLQSPSAVILEPPQNKVCNCFHCFSIYLPWSDGTGRHILVFWMLSFNPTFFIIARFGIVVTVFLIRNAHKGGLPNQRRDVKPRPTDGRFTWPTDMLRILADKAAYIFPVRGWESAECDGQQSRGYGTWKAHLFAAKRDPHAARAAGKRAVCRTFARAHRGLAVQVTLKSLLQRHSSKASILQCSAFFIVQLSHPYMTTGKTIALTRRTFVGKVMSLLLNMLSRLVITFLPRSKRLLISWLQSPSAVILEPRKIKSATISTVSPSICHEVMGHLLILNFTSINFTFLR